MTYNVKVGGKYKLKRFSPLVSTGVIHIVNIFKDNDTELVVYKEWSKCEQDWMYKCLTIYEINLHLEYKLWTK